MKWKTQVVDDFTIGNPNTEIEFPEYWDVLVQYFENIQGSTNLTKVITQSIMDRKKRSKMMMMNNLLK